MQVKYWISILFTVGLLMATAVCRAQAKKEVQPVPPPPPARDSAFLVDSARRAAIRKVTRHSAMVPGWGQVNNRQVWKVPIIYGGLGFIAYVFFNNVTEYRALRQAYIYRLDDDPANDGLIPEKYRPLSNNSIRFYRDEFRRNVDYSVLTFIIVWGLNVVDATVYAHLRGFDVSDELSLKIKLPQYQPATGFTTVGVALQLKQPRKALKPLPAR